MARVRLTDEAIRDFTCPADKTQAFLWDAVQPGLGVRATRTAKAGDKRGKSFIFQAPFMGRDLRMTIGGCDEWPLNNLTDKPGRAGRLVHLGAREKARQLQQDLDNGRDPREVKREATAADAAKRDAEKARGVKVATAWEEYLADRKPHWGTRHYADHESLAHPGGKARKIGGGVTTAGPLAAAMSMRLTDLTAEWLEGWAAREAAVRPARARLGLRLVRAFLGWCAAHREYAGLVSVDAAKSKRVREKLGKAERRQLVVQKEELPAWFAAVRGLSNNVIAAYLQFMLLTGARPNEPLTLKWEGDVDFRRRIIRIRDKIEGHRLIPMTPYVAHILAALPRRNEWVFSSSRSESGRLVEPGDAHDTACDLAELPRVTLQGLRRSFATLSEWVEIPAGVAMQIQGHAPQGVREQNYIRRPVDLLRVHHEKLEAWLLREAGVTFDAEARTLRFVRTVS